MSASLRSRTLSAPPVDPVEALRQEANALLAADRLDEATLAFGALAWRAPWCIDAWQGLAAALQRLDCEPAATLTAAIATTAATFPGSPRRRPSAPFHPPTSRCSDESHIIRLSFSLLLPSLPATSVPGGAGLSSAVLSEIGALVTQLQTSRVENESSQGIIKAAGAKLLVEHEAKLQQLVKAIKAADNKSVWQKVLTAFKVIGALAAACTGNPVALLAATLIITGVALEKTNPKAAMGLQLSRCRAHRRG